MAVFGALAYVQGLILIAIGVPFSWIARNWSQLAWWQPLVWPLVVGTIAFILEGIGTFFLNGFTFGTTRSRFRRVVGLIATILLATAVVVAWPLYQISQ